MKGRLVGYFLSRRGSVCGGSGGGIKERKVAAARRPTHYPRHRDGRTDRRTDRQRDITTGLSIASFAYICDQRHRPNDADASEGATVADAAMQCYNYTD